MYWWELGRAAALRDEPVTSFFGACRHADSTAGCSTALTMLVGDRAHGASMSKPCECQSISLLSCCGSAVPAYSLGPHSPCLQLYSPVRHFAMAPPCQSLANASLSLLSCCGLAVPTYSLGPHCSFCPSLCPSLRISQTVEQA